MNKTSERASRAFFNREKFKSSNTEVVNFAGITSLYLFDNLIAEMDEAGRVIGTLAGWNTVTTRQRLNALGFRFHQIDWQPYLNGTPISTRKWYRLSDFSEVE